MRRTDAILIELPVRAVTLSEDRAQVRRRAKVSLPAGRVRVRVSEVAPVLVDRTLQATVDATVQGGTVQGGKARVAEIRVERRYRGEAERDESISIELAERCRELEAQLSDLEGSRQDLDQQRLFLDAMAIEALADLTIDAAWGEVDADRFREELVKLVARDETLRVEALDLSQLSEDLKESLADLRERLQVGQRGDDVVAADLELDLAVDEAGEVLLEVGYVVPSACWRPRHTARLDREKRGERLTFITEASVWQRTGESWDDVELTFSTQRPSRGQKPPLLSEDRLEVRRQEGEVVVEARDVEVQTVGESGKPAKTTRAEVPGIYDGGSALAWKAPRRATVPSDGRPYRLELDRFEAKVVSVYLLIAERAAAVIHKVSVKNSATEPVLAGPVDLMAYGVAVGQSKVLYVAPGESFDLGFGPDPALRVHRASDRVEAKAKVVSRYVETVYSVVLKLSNVGGEARSFTVRERIPVSEAEQVKVHFDAQETSAGAERDEANGFVDWKVALAGGETRAVKLRYTVARRKNVKDDS
jgi:uncharacterized protein (TIGR02231 family)